MRVYLESLGCRLNYAEMALLGRQLAGAGHEMVVSAAEADVCVLNSCAVTGEAARKSRQMARHLARANPAARLVVTGCYATLEAEAVAALPNVTLVVGNTRKDELLGLIETRAAAGDAPGSADPVASAVSPTAAGREASARAAIPADGDGDRRAATANGRQAIALSLPTERTRAFVKVQDGCHNRCTFCIVTIARGEERSRPVAEIVDEINALHAAGYREAVLTGVHLGAYGRDRGGDLAGLVAALLADTDIPRLRLSSLEPFDLTSKFFDLWPQSRGRLMPHLHLPAQSGSDNVLRRMARRNRAADFSALAEAARARIPGLTLTTDLIVGFPGESEADFAASLAFAERIGFAHLHVFPYSARAGTAAARMSGQIPETERHRRSRVLNELDRKLGRAVRDGFLGQVRPVLWENPEPGAAATPGQVTWAGLTDNYLRVLADVPAGRDLHNQITPVRLVRREDEDLWGQL